MYVHVYRTRCNAIAKMTARCAQHMSALKIVCKHKNSRWLRKNLHITILSLFGGEIIFEVFQQVWSRYLNVTDGQTDGQFILWHHRRYYRYRRYFNLKLPVYCRFKQVNGIMTAKEITEDLMLSRNQPLLGRMFTHAESWEWTTETDLLTSLSDSDP